jgi:tetratricopeptide (TPR) repeat protein
MRKLRAVFLMMLAVGLCLLLAAPALAGPPGQGEGVIPADVYGPIVQGYSLLMEGKYDAAAVQFKKATKIDNSNPFALNNLAAIEGQKGNYKAAMALLQQATVKADKYKQKVAQTCFVAGLCTAVKPTKELGSTSTIAPIIQENIAKLKPKIAAMPPKPASPPPMESVPKHKKGK